MRSGIPLEQLMKEIEQEDLEHGIFLLQHGWTRDGEKWQKDLVAVPSYDTEYLGAVGMEILSLIKSDGWRVIKIQTSAVPQMAYFVSPVSGKMYSWLEVRDLYLGRLVDGKMVRLEESDIVCCAKTIEINKLFPDIKPDVIKVRLCRQDNGEYLYEI